MNRTEQFERAAVTLTKIAAIESLSGGYVRFEEDLSGGRWYESKADAEDSGGGVVVEVPPHDTVAPNATRVYARAGLAASLTYAIETLPRMVDVLEESGREGLASQFRERVAFYIAALGGGEVVALEAV